MKSTHWSAGWPKKTLMIVLHLCCMLNFAAAGSSAAEPEDCTERKNRLELSGAYEYLSPKDDYGDWTTGTLSFYRKESPGFTWFMQGGLFMRNEGKGALAAAGAYKDWTDRLFTFTSVAVGTNSEYLPEVRVDHDFNIKFGPAKNLVWVLGGSYIQYHGPHKDYIVSTGLVVYLDKWVAEYRLFRNQSDPGSVESYSHLFSLAYGQECRQWTTATFSFGRQAYLAVELATPQGVSNESQLFTLNHRRWIGNGYGIFGEFSYFNLETQYHKTGVMLGVFREF